MTRSGTSRRNDILRAVTRAVLVIALCAAVGASSGAADDAPAASMRGDTLHRMTLLRAAPGRLLELVAAVKGRGLVLRHSQGDQWDLMVLTPVASYADLGGAAPLAEPGLVAWQEDELVRGPELGRLDGFTSAGLYHIEMFVALAGRRGDLVREREMENAYLAALGRPRNAIFVRELGAAWDAFTVGAYRSWKHFAERDDIPPDRSMAAARAAGFDGDDRIGPYLRSLIQSHHDTLATPVR
jgi:hypothetical protein